MKSKHIFRVAIAGESSYACIGATSPLPDVVNNIDAAWLPMRFDGGQLSDQPGDPALLGTVGMSGDFGGFADEIDSLPLTGQTKQFLFRTGTFTVGLHPFSVPDFAEDAARFPSLLRTPTGRLLSSFLAPRGALATRTLTVGSHDGDGVFTSADDPLPADVFVGQMLGRDIGGRREASVVTGINTLAVTHAPHGPAMVPDEVLRLAQVWEGTGHRDVGPSVAFKLDHLTGRDYAVGCRVSSMAISLARRRAAFGFTVDAPIIFTDRDAADVLSGANVRDIIREPGARQHLTFAGTKPRVGPNAWSIDADATIPMTVAGELLAIDELAMTVTAELGVRGTFDGVGEGDRETDSLTYDATIHLSQPPSALALDALADARSNYHLFVLPMGPTGAHGGCLAFYGTITSDLRKLDRAKSYQRVALKVRSVSGPVEVPFRLGLF